MTVITLRPYQEEAVGKVTAGVTRGVRRQLGVAATGLGKGLVVGTPVLKSDGSWCRVEALEVGDFVIGGDGQLIKVEGVFERGEQPCFEITTDDGASVTVDADHLWTVTTDYDINQGRPWRTLETADLYQRGVVSPEGRRRWRLPIVNPIEFDPQPELPIDPYVLGVLLGDGSIVQGCVSFCPGDEWIAEKVKTLLPEGFSLGVVTQPERPTTYNIKDPEASPVSPNCMKLDLIDLGLWGLHSLKKFIPTAYLTAPIHERRALLAGLMDCDGWVGKASPEFTTSSERLAGDVRDLAESLGCVARLRSKIPTYTYGGEKCMGARAYALSIRGASCPFTLPRKAEKWNEHPRLGATRKIKSIIPVSPQETVCIKVSAEDGLFVTEGHIVTHNTIMFSALAERMATPTLILAHRDELITQAVDKLKQVWPDADVGVVKASRNEVDHQVVVASVQTLSRRSRLEQLPADKFGLVVIDECFPAGTLISGRPIETLNVGDVVASYSESNGKIEDRAVAALMKRKPSAMVRISMQDGSSLACTADHPVLTTKGWCQAKELWHGASMIRWHHAKATQSSGTDDLHRVPRANASLDKGPEGSVEGCWEGVLLNGTSRRMGVAAVLDSNGQNQPQVCLGADEKEQPDGAARERREDEGHPQRNGAQAPRSSREWPRPYGTAGDAQRSIDVGYGTCSPNRDGEKLGLAKPLQDRHSESVDLSGNRGRRDIPFLEGAPALGSEEGLLLERVGVDRVEILEPTGDGTFGGVCPDGFVYNIEVEDNHTYVANGFVVHNCHHAKATTYINICDYLRAGKEDGPVLLGVTATPDRGDGKGLDDIFDEIIFSYDMLWGIRSGYLADLRGMRVYLEDVNFSDAKIRKGDYDVGETGRMLEAADAPALIAEAWQKYASERKTIVFTPTVATATLVRDELRALGAASEMVSGETPLEERRDILKRFSTGEVQVVSNCMVLTEGFDEPAASCIVMARPTRSRALYAQCIGRGSRRHPDKEDCLVIDVVGVSDELSLVTIPSLFGIEKVDGFEGAGETVAEAVQAQEEEAVRKGKLAAAAVELFRKVLESHIAWVHYDNRFGKKAYQCQLGERKLGTVVIEHTPNQAPDAEAPTWDCYLRWDAQHAPVGGTGVRSLPNGGAYRTLISGVDLEMAQGTGEDYVRKNGISALTDRNAAWRKRPPTERQLEAAEKWGLKVDPAWNAGRFSEEMSAHIAKKKERSRNTPQWAKDKYRRSQ